jgi:hypothetical protein
VRLASAWNAEPGAARKLSRALVLAGRWTRYLREQPDRRRARRELWEWFRTTFAGGGLLARETPWVTFAARGWLAGYLDPTMSVFEWGSGASTLFLARRVAHVVSIEYEQRWFRSIGASMERSGLGNVDLRHIEPGPAGRPDPPGSEPGGFTSSDALYRGRSFERYVRSIESFPDRTFDLVWVDGRSRVACARACVPKVKEAGAVLLDDSDREDTADALPLFPPDLWTARHFEGPGPSCLWPGFWRTTVFHRRR